MVGAKNFSEQYILAQLIEERLHGAGYRTERRDNLGSAIAYRAVAAGDIDVYVDYSGTLWANVLERKDNPPRDGNARDAHFGTCAARTGCGSKESLGFENAYAFAMKRKRAGALGIETLEDLAAKAPQLRLASDLEFLSRPEWKAVEAAYGLRFKDARSYSPTFMYRALEDGSAEVISAFSSDGRIAAQDLVTLTDPRHALPSYDAVLLLAPGTDQAKVAEAPEKPLIGGDRDNDSGTPAMRRVAMQGWDGRFDPLRERMRRLGELSPSRSERPSPSCARPLQAALSSPAGGRKAQTKAAVSALPAASGPAARPDILDIAPAPALGRIVAFDDRMAGLVEMRARVAVRGSSQQPTWPQVRHSRKWTHGLPIFRHSSQPLALGVTSRDLVRMRAFLVAVQAFASSFRAVRPAPDAAPRPPARRRRPRRRPA